MPLFNYGYLLSIIHYPLSIIHHPSPANVTWPMVRLVTGSVAKLNLAGLEFYRWKNLVEEPILGN